MGYRMVTSPMTSRDLEGSNPITLTAQYLENYLSYRLQIWFALLQLCIGNV